MGNCAHKLCRNRQGERDRRAQSGGKPGALRLQENRRRLENCALLLLHYQSATRMKRRNAMTTMKAAVIREAGGPEVLKIESLPIPRPQTGQVLIHVKAF